MSTTTRTPGVDDILRDLHIDWDRDHGRRRRPCEHAFAHCDRRAEFMLRTRNDRYDGRSYYCAKHFALALHRAIDDATTNRDFADPDLDQDDRERLFSYAFQDWCRL